MIVKIVSEDCKDVRNYCEDGDHENPPAFLPLEGEREAVDALMLLICLCC